MRFLCPGPLKKLGDIVVILPPQPGRHVGRQHVFQAVLVLRAPVAVTAHGLKVVEAVGPPLGLGNDVVDIEVTEMLVVAALDALVPSIVARPAVREVLPEGCPVIAGAAASAVAHHFVQNF